MRNFSKITAVVFAAVAVLVLSTVSFARGWTQMNGQWYFTDGSGEVVTNTIKTSGTTKYYLGDDGAMVTNTFVEDYNDYSYYFGANGAMVTNTWVAVDPAILSSVDDNAPSAYWFYFGTNGKAYRANGSSTTVKKTIDGNKYIFDDAGHMLTGWINDEGQISEDEENPFETAIYYAGGENDGVLRKGWHAYVDGVDDSYNDAYGESYGRGGEGSGWDPSDADVLWLYFQPSNCKKLTASENSDADALKTKKINGKTYAFTHAGLMFEGWRQESSTSYALQYKYYNGSAGGHLVKKGWIYDVPTENQNYDDQDDSEERYFYADGSGKTVVGQTKKINNKYYIFDRSGIMKTGLLITTAANKYINKVKLDETDGKRFIAHDMFVPDEKDYVVPRDNIDSATFDGTTYYYAYDPDWSTVQGSGVGNRVFYFNDDGARVNGTVTLEFADNDYVFVSSNSGGYMGSKNNGSRYYANGLALRANPDIRYGIVMKQSRETVVNKYKTGDTWANDGVDEVTLADVVGVGVVVTTTGSKVKKNAIKKDGNDNYWVIQAGLFRGVYNVQMKRSGDYYQFKSDFFKPGSLDTTSGYGWCYHNGASLHSTIGNCAAYTAANASSETAGRNASWYSCDINGKTAVYPMERKGTTDFTGVTALGLPAGISVDQDFNATIEDDMAVDFYWDDAEKNN